MLLRNEPSVAKTLLLHKNVIWTLGHIIEVVFFRRSDVVPIELFTKVNAEFIFLRSDLNTLANEGIIGL